MHRIFSIELKGKISPYPTVDLIKKKFKFYPKINNNRKIDKKRKKKLHSYYSKIE